MTSFNTNRQDDTVQIHLQTGWLVNTSVGWKLTIIIIVLAIGTLGIFLSALTGLQSLSYHLTNMYEFTLIPITDIDRADIALSDIQAQLEALRSPFLTPAEKATRFRAILDTEDRFTTSLYDYETKWLTTLRPAFTQILQDAGRLDLQQDEISSLETIKSSYDKYILERQKVQLNLAVDRYDSQSANATVTALADTRSQLQTLITVNLQFADLSNKAARAAYGRAIMAMASTLTVVALVGLVLVFVVARSITRRLGQVTRVAQALEQGQRDQRATAIVGGRDEIAEVAIAFDSMATQLTQTLTGLEQRVVERTADLETRSNDLAKISSNMEKRAAQLQAIALVARTVTSIQSIEDLLPRVTSVISEQFGFYHVGIFLLDESKTYAVLAATNSPGGQKMLERGHKLRVGETGIVGYVANTGRPRIALDTGADAVFFSNPDLPQTHSEMALPLKVGNEILGILDVQSELSAAFGTEDIELLAILSDQVSIAIQNARQFQEVQKSTAEAEALLGQSLRRQWTAVARKRKSPGYRYMGAGANPLEKRVETPETRQAIQSGETRVLEEKSQSKLAVPIKLRGQVIGLLNIQFNGERPWDQDEIDISQAVADRVAIAIENARLFQDAQRRASKERIIGEIGSRITSSVNIDGILQTAAKELGLAIPDSEVVIQFQNPESE